MNTVTGTADTLSAGLLFDMAHYRYRIFVERLGWTLSPCGRLELDQFDRRDTIYIIARKDDCNVCGTARLLSTERPYLLAQNFPQLLGGHAPPRSKRIWEISRFAAIDLDAPSHRTPCFGASRDALALLDSVMRAAVSVGAQHLITVSPLGVERILRRAGVAVTRLASPTCVNDQMLAACCIHLAPSLTSQATWATEATPSAPRPQARIETLLR